MRLLNAFVHVMAASIRTASVFIRMTKIVDKKESLRKMFYITSDLEQRGKGPKMHHIFILRNIHSDFETKGVLFMVMQTLSFSALAAVKSLFYYNAPLNMLSTRLPDVTCFRSQMTGNCIMVEGV